MIIKVARKRIRRKPGNKVVLALRKASGSSRSLAVPSTNDLVTTNFSSDVSTSSPNASPDKMAANNNGMTTGVEKDCIKTQVMSKKRVHQRESIEAKRERKAAKTLAIITGLFVVCWLPFFIVALLMPLCQSCRENLPAVANSVFLWLGYINSCVNPIIYTIFSPDFRTAFKKILCARRNYRSQAKTPTRV